MSDERPEGAQGGNDSGWTPPATQEEFNRMIAPRLERERAKFADYEALKAKAAKVDEAEQASKTAEQKLTEQITTLQAQFEAQQKESVRLSVIAKHGIPTDYQDLVIGADEAALEASATKLKTLIGSKNQGPFPPKADPSQGAGGGQGKQSPAQQFADFIQKQREGR